MRALRLCAVLLGLALVGAFPGGGQFPGNCDASTGGTITVSGGKRIHTFTSTGTFVASGGCTITYLIVAGGGSGGGGDGGGGGAGGLLTGSTTIGAASYAVTVGTGGAAAAVAVTGNNGN